jgi:predicted ATPase
MTGGGRVATAPDMGMVATSSLCCMGRNRCLVSERARELSALREEWQRSTLGELRVALVFGDPGLRKTRLVSELLPHSAEFPAGLLAHSCLFRSMPPFGPWADTLGLRAGRTNGDRASQVYGSGLGHLPPVVRGTLAVVCRPTGAPDLFQEGVMG